METIYYLTLPFVGTTREEGLKKASSKVYLCSGVFSINDNIGSSINAITFGPLRFGVRFQDDLIAIRVPNGMELDQLRDRLQDRLKFQEEIIA